MALIRKDSHAIAIGLLAVTATIALALSGPPSAARAATTAQTATQKIADVSFLIGHWHNGAGTVTDTRETSRGSSTITSELGGAALLRRDHTDLFSADGKPMASFDQFMMIYPEGGTLHADYADGTHVIHYTSAVVVPGRFVTFTSATNVEAPTYRLTYDFQTPPTLAIHFEIAAPGTTTFRPIATGALTKDPT